MPVVLVVPDEQRDHDQALHGRADVAPDHPGRAGWPCPPGTAAGLPSSRSARARPGTAGRTRCPRWPLPAIADRGELVAAEDLLHVPLGDHVAGGRPAVAGHDHAAGRRPRRRSWWRAAGPRLMSPALPADGRARQRPAAAPGSRSGRGEPRKSVNDGGPRASEYARRTCRPGCRQSTLPRDLLPVSASSDPTLRKSTHRYAAGASAYGRTRACVTGRPSGRRTGRTPRRSPRGPRRSRRGSRRRRRRASRAAP